MTRTRPVQYAVDCPCGWGVELASEAAAVALRDDHDAQCTKAPEVRDL